MKKVLALVVIVAGFLAGFLALPRLPAAVSPDFSELLPFLPLAEARPAGKGFVAFGLPTVALVVCLVMTMAPSRPIADALRKWLPSLAFGASLTPEELARQRETASAVALAVAIIIVAMHGAGLATALGAPPSVYHVVPLLMGLALIIGGNSTPRLRRNWFAGVRTPTTLQSPTVWARVHRLLGRLLVVTGIVTVGTTVVAGRFALTVAIVGLLASVVISHLVEGRTRVSTQSSPSRSPR